MGRVRNGRISGRILSVAHQKIPLRGEIRFVQLPVDPLRKVAGTVLVLSVTTRTHKEGATHVYSVSGLRLLRDLAQRERAKTFCYERFSAAAAAGQLPDWLTKQTFTRDQL
jgi:hypothetical protein